MLIFKDIKITFFITLHLVEIILFNVAVYMVPLHLHWQTLMA